MSLDVSLIDPTATYEVDELYGGNITHNLTGMAKQAGIYNDLWNPLESGQTRAKDLIKPLKTGLKKLKSDPQHFKTFNSPNGWGMYENFITFLEAYLEALRKYPKAKIKISK